MNRISTFLLVALLVFSGNRLQAQQDAQQEQGGNIVKQLNLQEVVALAREQSLMAILSRHRYRSSYWAFKSHRAEYLPSLTLNATLPSLTNATEAVPQPDGSYIYRNRSVMQNSLDLELNQNIGFTGGRIFMSSQLQRTDNWRDEHSTDYLAYPVTIGFYQPINGYNRLKWDKKIEPMKFEQAKLEYINSMEEVSQRAVGYFFDMALAQINLQTAIKNMANSDTLYNIATGRYQLGTIAEDELLSMELGFLNAGAAMNKSTIDLELSKSRLRTFLGFNDRVNLELLLPAEIPDLELDYTRIQQEAEANNPEVMDMKRQLLEAQKSVAEARSQKGFRGNLYAEFGLNQYDETLAGAYQNLQPQERINIGIQMPILDWGQGKGRYKMATSAEEVVRTNVQQSMINFDENVFLQVMSFNLQDDQVDIAAKSDTIADLRYEVAKQRFLIGRIDVLGLNDALEAKDRARSGFVQALRAYWNYFYDIRALTLYDWVRDEKLIEDYEDLLDQ